MNTETVDVCEFVETQMDEMKILPKGWKFCKVPTIENLRTMNGMAVLVWPNEGKFVKDIWHFNEEHAGFEPILIDRNSARLFVQAYDLASDGSKLILAKKLTTRGQFCFMVEWLWSKATFKK